MGAQIERNRHVVLAALAALAPPKPSAVPINRCVYAHLARKPSETLPTAHPGAIPQLSLSSTERTRP
jgi:hypothetical protein